MWFVLRMGEGVVYYFLALIVNAVLAILAAPFAGQYEQNLAPVMTGMSAAVLAVLLLSTYIKRRLRNEST